MSFTVVSLFGVVCSLSCALQFVLYNGLVMNGFNPAYFAQEERNKTFSPEQRHTGKEHGEVI